MSPALVNLPSHRENSQARSSFFNRADTNRYKGRIQRARQIFTTISQDVSFGLKKSLCQLDFFDFRLKSVCYGSNRVSRYDSPRFESAREFHKPQPYTKRFKRITHIRSAHDRERR